jgi:hypothetical protein
MKSGLKLARARPMPTSMQQKQSGPKTAAQRRTERLALRLRDNLKRRKDAARAAGATESKEGDVVRVNSAMRDDAGFPDAPDLPESVG